MEGENCVQTNLPLPRNQEVYYWEAKMYDKPESTLVSVGVATKPYPSWRLPGLAIFVCICSHTQAYRLINLFRLESLLDRLLF